MLKITQGWLVALDQNTAYLLIFTNLYIFFQLSLDIAESTIANLVENFYK